jgi:hypothetical protein
MKKIKEWSKKHPWWFVFIGTLLFLLLKHMPLHADERTSCDYMRDSIVDVIGAAVAFTASAEQAATGNFYTGASLFMLGSIEAENAWNNAKNAWDSRDGNSDSSCACGSMGTENNH